MFSLKNLTTKGDFKDKTLERVTLMVAREFEQAATKQEMRAQSERRRGPIDRGVQEVLPPDKANAPSNASRKISTAPLGGGPVRVMTSNVEAN